MKYTEWSDLVYNFRSNFLVRNDDECVLYKYKSLNPKSKHSSKWYPVIENIMNCEGKPKVAIIVRLSDAYLVGVEINKGAMIMIPEKFLSYSGNNGVAKDTIISRYSVPKDIMSCFSNIDDLRRLGRGLQLLAFFVVEPARNNILYNSFYVKSFEVRCLYGMPVLEILEFAHNWQSGDRVKNDFNEHNKINNILSEWINEVTILKKTHLKNNTDMNSFTWIPKINNFLNCGDNSLGLKINIAKKEKYLLEIVDLEIMNTVEKKWNKIVIGKLNEYWTFIGNSINFDLNTIMENITNLLKSKKNDDIKYGVFLLRLFMLFPAQSLYLYILMSTGFYKQAGVFSIDKKEFKKILEAEIDDKVDGNIATPDMENLKNSSLYNKVKENLFTSSRQSSLTLQAYLNK